MKLDDSFVLVAPRAEVWEFFLDIDRLARCMPGVERVEEVDDTHYKGTLVVPLGPVKAKFVGEVTITERIAPERMTGSFQARDKGAGSNVSATFAFTLVETQPHITTARCDVDLVIRGKMAAFGGSIIAETSKQMTVAFAAVVQAELLADQQAAGGEGVTGHTASGMPLARPVSAPPKVSPVGIMLKSVWAVIVDKVGRLFHRKGSDQHG